MRRTLHDFRPESATWQVLQGTESALAGAGAGLVSAVVTCPLDVIKTKLQAEGFLGGKNPRYKGLTDTAIRIWTEEGLRGLYRGLGPTIFGYLPTWSIYFTCYDRVKAYMSTRRNTNEDDLVSHITAAMVAGATSSTVTNPLWVIKTRFMTQRPEDKAERYRNTLDAIRRIYRSEGIPGFYRGLLPSLLGVTHVAVQFPLYEHFKALNRPTDGSEVKPSIILVCSSASKMIASIATYPHEVLRTRLQIHRMKRTVEIVAADEATSASILGICRHIWRHDGLPGFYRGLTVNLIRTVPSSGFTILTYEMLMRNLLRRTGSKREAM